MIVQYNPIIKKAQQINSAPHQIPSLNYANKDIVSVENFNIDKKPLIDRKIISPDKNINEFFDEISFQIFSNSPMKHSFSNLLKQGYVSLSSSAYSNLKDPKSAIALKLDEKKSSVQHCAKLEEYLNNGVGVGINFSNFDNPINTIKYTNKYFKYREPSLNRPPAGIALLNINHPKILEFITLKDNANYKDWCFDISVVVDSEFLSKVDNNEEIILSNGEKKSAKEIYFKLLNSMLKKGEPGIIFSDKKDFVCDCCACAELNENEGLNLAQINLSKFYNKETCEFDYEFLSQSANVLSSALKQIAPNGFISVLGFQDLLNKMNLAYGEKKADLILENSLKIIQAEAHLKGLRTAISPSGITSRVLKTSFSIEPNNSENLSYWEEIDTMATAQKYLDGGISKTINLKPHHTIQDVDFIIRHCASQNIKGVTVFPAQ